MLEQDDIENIVSDFPNTSSERNEIISHKILTDEDSNKKHKEQGGHKNEQYSEKGDITLEPEPFDATNLAAESEFVRLTVMTRK